VLREIDFLLKTFANGFNSVAGVETGYLNIDMCKFESSQCEGGRAQSAASSKACSKPRAFKYNISWKIQGFLTLLLWCTKAKSIYNFPPWIVILLTTSTLLVNLIARGMLHRTKTDEKLKCPMQVSRSFTAIKSVKRIVNLDKEFIANIFFIKTLFYAGQFSH